MRWRQKLVRVTFKKKKIPCFKQSQFSKTSSKNIFEFQYDEKCMAIEKYYSEELESLEPTLPSQQVSVRAYPIRINQQ